SPTIAGFTLNSPNATFSASGRTLTVNGPADISAGATLWSSSTWAGSGTLTNNASMSIVGDSTISSSFVQNGSVFIQGSDSNGDATLTAAAGFTNAGQITLQNISQIPHVANLYVTSGTLTNTGTLLVGGSNGTGGRNIKANLTNTGTVTLNE